MCIRDSSGTYSAASTTATITVSGGHNLEIGQAVFLNFTSYNSGAVPIDGTFTIVTIVTIITMTLLIFGMDFGFKNTLISMLSLGG